MAQNIYQMAVDYMEDGLLDINENYSADVVAKAAQELVEALLPKEGIIYKEAEVTLADLRIKAHNARNNSWLSVSNDEATGVSRSLVYMVNPHRKRVSVDDIAYTLDMINEAWYSLIN